MTTLKGWGLGLGFATLLLAGTGCADLSSAEGSHSAAAKDLVPEAAITTASSSATEQQFGISQWKIYRSKSDLHMTGYDKHGKAVMGLTTGFVKSPNGKETQLRTKLNDGSGFQAFHGLKTHANLANQDAMSDQSSAFVKAAFDDSSRMNAIFRTHALTLPSTANTCGIDLSAVMAQALQCMQGQVNTKAEQSACLVAAQNAIASKQTCQNVGTTSTSPAPAAAPAASSGGGSSAGGGSGSGGSGSGSGSSGSKSSGSSGSGKSSGESESDPSSTTTAKDPTTTGKTTTDPDPTTTGTTTTVDPSGKTTTTSDPQNPSSQPSNGEFVDPGDNPCPTSSTGYCPGVQEAEQQENAKAQQAAQQQEMNNTPVGTVAGSSQTAPSAGVDPSIQQNNGGAAVGLGGTDPSTTPGTTDPSAPGSTDPSSTDPSSTDPTTFDPGETAPGSSEPITINDDSTFQAQSNEASSETSGSAPMGNDAPDTSANSSTGDVQSSSSGDSTPDNSGDTSSYDNGDSSYDSASGGGDDSGGGGDE